MADPGKALAPAALTTPRLRVRALAAGDTAFMLTLLNEPSFISNIGDRGVRTEADALEYLAAGPLASYARHGFGLCAVDLAASGEPIGICGLLQREELPSPDLGFALLPRFWSQGYAFEAASAVMADARQRLALSTLLAIVSPGNTSSIRLLERLGFTWAGHVRLKNGSHDLTLFSSTAA